MLPQRLLPTAIAVLLGGCFTFPTEGDRQMIDQSEKGSKLICEMTQDERVLEIAQAIYSSQQQLGLNLGKPKGQTSPFSPEASRIYQAQSVKEHKAQRAFWGALGNVGGILGSLVGADGLTSLLGGGGAISVLLGLWERLKRKREERGHQATSNTLGEMAEEHPDPEQAKKLLGKLKKTHQAKGVAHIGKRVYSNVEQKG